MPCWFGVPGAAGVLVPVRIRHPNSGATEIASALLDTGAQRSCISVRLRSRLSLGLRGQERITTVLGFLDADTYPAHLEFCVRSPSGAEEPYTIAGVPLIEVPELGKADLLIGWDILSAASITIQSVGRHASLCF